MNPSACAATKGILEKIAVELDSAEPEKDAGLLPLNCLLSELETATAGQDLAEPLVQSLKLAQGWIDEIFNTTVLFSETSLTRFQQWSAWWQKAFLRFAQGENSPALPPDFSAVPAAKVLTAQTDNKATIDLNDSFALEPVLKLDVVNDRELLAEFVNEGQEHLQNIEQGALGLEDNPQDGANLNAIFRAFHTFKGGAGFLNLGAIQKLAHELESLLDNVRQHKLAITPPIINLILEGRDTLKAFMGEIAKRLSGGSQDEIIIPTRALLAKINAINAGTLERSAEPLLSSAISAATIPSSLDSTSAVKDPVETPEVTSSSVKVDTAKLDSLIDLVGEMIITQSQVAHSSDLFAQTNERLQGDLAKLNRLTRELQHTALSLRMVPIRATLLKMKRAVRDLAGKTGKEVELVTEGEGTELDRTLVEEISGPLMHMIRNSIDHGIETPELRRQRGKPAIGKITLRAFHQGGQVVIEVIDDGNGLDRNRILTKAVEKGLMQPGDNPGEQEIFGLIMAPGFSTAEKITAISGRGVGMDVVKRNIDKLRGKIEIYSTPGQGSRFVISLPLTLAIIDGLLVRVGEQNYIIPTASVRELFRPTIEMISTVQGKGELVSVRGKLLPLVRLYESLGIPPRTTDPTKAIMLVVQAGKTTRCVLVDDLTGKQEVVIKSLGETFARSRFVSGAAILADGHLGLILDAHALVQAHRPEWEIAA